MRDLPSEVTLWENADGIRCVSHYGQAGPPFEIIIVHGDQIVTRRAFEHDDDAADFAIASMHQDDRYWRRVIRDGQSFSSEDDGSRRDRRGSALYGPIGPNRS